MLNGTIRAICPFGEASGIISIQLSNTKMVIRFDNMTTNGKIAKNIT